MAFQYCTIEQVLNVARIYLPDVSDNTLPPQDINSAIDEVEVQVNAILSPRYSLDKIQADVPFTVHRLAACLTACILLGRYHTIQTDGTTLAYIKQDIVMYTKYLASNAVFDDMNKAIATVIRPTQAVRPTQLDGVYANGPRSY